MRTVLRDAGIWVVQQARNASMWLDEQGIEARFILHDRDTKYSEAFREFRRSNGTEGLRSPIRVPNAYEYLRGKQIFGRDSLGGYPYPTNSVRLTNGGGERTRTADLIVAN